jgi:hypothetical protein
MMTSDIALARRLERAEGYACRSFAKTAGRLLPERGSAWIECAGTWAVYDGLDSPLTQTFGLGLFEPVTPESLDMIERFFFERGCDVAMMVAEAGSVSQRNAERQGFRVAYTRTKWHLAGRTASLS